MKYDELNIYIYGLVFRGLYFDIRCSKGGGSKLLRTSFSLVSLLSGVLSTILRTDRFVVGF